MKPFDIKQQFIPLYLLVILLLQSELTFLTLVMVSVPIIVIMASIHVRQKNLAFLGLFLLCLVSLSLISIGCFS